MKVLTGLDEIATLRNVPVASVSLAWLLGQRSVSAPIASARNAEQLADLLPAAELKLTDAELQWLSDAFI